MGGTGFMCLERCYSGIEYKSEYIDLYGPYYCEEICYPICEVQIYPDDPLIPECGIKIPLPEEDQTTPLTTQTVQDELIQEQCRETCRNEYGIMATGKTGEYNPNKPKGRIRFLARTPQKIIPQIYVKQPKVNLDLCVHCNVCINMCPVGAIDKQLNIDNSKCIRCLACVKYCKSNARVLETRYKILESIFMKEGKDIKENTFYI